jgi:hypothetical protein
VARDRGRTGPRTADACCGPEDPHADEGPARIWRVRELRRAAAAAVLLWIAWLVDRAGGAGLPVAGIALAAAVVGASTFVPAHCGACGTAGSGSAP